MKKVILILIILSLLAQGQSFALRLPLQFNEPGIPITMRCPTIMPYTQALYIIDYLFERYVNSDKTKTRLFVVIERDRKDTIVSIVSKEDDGTIKLWEKYKLIKGSSKAKGSKYSSGKWELFFVNVKAYVTGEEMRVANRHYRAIPRSHSIRLPSYLLKLSRNISSVLTEEKGDIIAKLFSRERDDRIIVWERLRLIQYEIMKKQKHYYIGTWKRIFNIEDYTISKEIPIAVSDLMLIPEATNKLYIPHYLMETYVNPDRVRTRLFAVLKRAKNHVNAKIISKGGGETVKEWGNHKFIPRKIRKKGIEFAGKWEFQWDNDLIQKMSTKSPRRKTLFYLELKRQLKMGNQIKDYYKRLGLSIYATTDEIKKAYRRLSMEFHPDKGNDPDAEVFKSVSKAYEVLKDTEKRESYKRLMRNRFTDTELKKLNNYLEQPENVGIIFHHDKNMNKRIFLVSRKVIAEAVGIDPDRIDWAIDKHNYQQNRNGKGYFTPFAFSPEKMLNGMNGVLETADVLRTDN